MAINSTVWFFAVAPVKLGGLEIFTARMAELHPSVQFTFCFTSEPSDKVRAAFPANAQFVVVAKQGGFDWSLKSLFSKWQLLRATRPDLVAYRLGGAIRPLPWIAKLAGARVIYMDATSRTRDFRTRGLRGTLQRLVTRPVSLVIAVSQYTRQAGIRENILSCPSVVIPNGVDGLRPHVSGTVFREKWGIPLDARLVTQCSWLTPSKGADLFIETARRLSGPNTVFLIAGEGEHRQEYQRLAADVRVIFTGRIDDPMAEGLYAASDIFCLPSRWQEACGLVNLEAMSFGVPVVASRVGGIPEYVPDGDVGLLIEPTADDLTEKVARLLEDEALRHRLGEAARVRALKLYSLDGMVKAYAAAMGFDDEAQ